MKWKEETDVILKPTSKNGLKKKSLIRLSKLAILDKDLALGRLGRIEKSTMASVNKNLKRIFELDD